jgi:hypothetical protein
MVTTGVAVGVGVTNSPPGVNLAAVRGALPMEWRWPLQRVRLARARCCQQQHHKSVNPALRDHHHRFLFVIVYLLLQCCWINKGR